MTEIYIELINPNNELIKIMEEFSTKTEEITTDIVLDPRRAKQISDMNILGLIISFATGVSSGLVTNWIWSKVKGRADGFRVSQRRIELTKENTISIVEMLIEKKS